MQDVLNEIWNAALGEFADLPDAAEFTRVVVRLSVAMLLGGMLGLEREMRGNAAGLRTHMLVALGAALFVLVPLQAGTDVADMSRVLQGVIAGVGFLGAGAILKNGGREIHGLTTAASIWLTAAIGIAAGMGRELTAILSAVFALVILALVRKLTHARQARRRRLLVAGGKWEPPDREGAGPAA